MLQRYRLEMSSSTPSDQQSQVHILNGFFANKVKEFVGDNGGPMWRLPWSPKSRDCLVVSYLVVITSFESRKPCTGLDWQLGLV